MNLELIGNLIRLRYKLMWAKTRTRNGKIALFFAGYILLIMFIAITASGGLGAGIIAVRSGKAYKVAAALLAGMFLQALLATVVLGFGINAIFADLELRRYPLRARDRWFVRQFIGIVDPFWIVILTLEIGLAAGIYFFGASSLLLSIAAVLLLFISNYLFARVVGQLVERLVSKKGGSSILLGLVMACGILPGAIANSLKGKPQVVEAILRVLKFSPPAGAALAMTSSDLSGLPGLAILILWIVVLAGSLMMLERRPVKSQSARAGKLTWDSPFERFGSILGAENAVLVGQWLRFFSRNNRFRMSYPLTIPLAAFMIFAYARQLSPATRFVTTLGAFSLIGVLGTLQFAVNQFGYTGGGFRRYLLLPTNPAAVFRAGSYTFLLLGAVLIPAATLVLIVFRPVPVDWRTVLIFSGAAAVNLFLLNAVAVWITLLAPRKGNFDASFGNDLSFAANVVVIGSIMTFMFGPRVIARFWPDLLTPDHWWGILIVLPLSVAIYFASLGRASHVFVQRRERLLAIVEGRDT